MKLRSNLFRYGFFKTFVKEQENSNPEQTLFGGVIDQALIDTTYVGTSVCRAAEKWVRCSAEADQEGFLEVCHLAGLDPVFVQTTFEDQKTKLREELEDDK